MVPQGVWDWARVPCWGQQHEQTSVRVHWAGLRDGHHRALLRSHGGEKPCTYTILCTELRTHPLALTLTHSPISFLSSLSSSIHSTGHERIVLIHLRWYFWQVSNPAILFIRLLALSSVPLIILWAFSFIVPLPSLIPPAKFLSISLLSFLLSTFVPCFLLPTPLSLSSFFLPSFLLLSYHITSISSSTSLFPYRPTTCSSTILSMSSVFKPRTITGSSMSWRSYRSSIPSNQLNTSALPCASPSKRVLPCSGWVRVCTPLF